MDAEALREIFEPFGPVAVRRLFGGHGVYADGLCFAIEIRGEVFIKADAGSVPEFVEAGSRPFVYEMKGKPKSMAYWLLVDAAYDDEQELRRWASLGLSAARRYAAAKVKPALGVRKR